MENIKDYFRADEIINAKSSTSATVVYTNDPKRRIESSQVVVEEMELTINDHQMLRSEIFLP
jgi:hypothetical protein